MKIGLVLSNAPTISETFLISKIKGLKSIGNDMVLFANNISDFNICKAIPHPTTESNIIILIFKIIFSYIRLIVIRPSVFFRFLRLEKKDRVPFIRRWKNLYLNNHILSIKLDWIHFGFITLTINRQNVAGAIKAKMGVSLRGYDICIYPLTHKNCYENVWGKVDKLHSISNDLLKVAQDNGLPLKIPQQIIKPAVDLNIFNNNQKRWKNPDKINFLTIARLHWKKGLEHTLHALSILDKKGILFFYTIIGEGIELERLIYAVNQLDIEKSVKFVGGLSHYQTKRYYENADVYLQYSIQEGYCNATLEAQAMGLVTIVSDAEGLPENVKNKSWVVPKNNPIVLANKIKSIIEYKKENIDKATNNALRRIEKENSVKIQLKNFSKFYEK